MTVNPKVDSPDGVLDVPGLSVIYQTAWKLRLIKINGRSPALAAISRWENTSKQDFEQIMGSVRLVGTSRLPPPLPFAQKSDLYDVYEMCAPRGKARLVFFYDRTRGAVVATNAYEASGREERDRALSYGERIRQHYLTWPPSLQLL